MPDRGPWLLLPRPIRRLPADLAAVLVLVALTDVAVLAPGVSETPLRIVLGLPLVLFLPGYALVAALFPEAGASPVVADGTDGPAGGDVDDRRQPVGGDDVDRADAPGRTGRVDTPTARDGIDGVERVALAFGLSIAVSPLLGLALNFTPWGIRLVPIVVVLTAFTAGCAVVAAVRRWALPAEERFAVPYRDWVVAGRRELVAPETRLDAALNVLLVCSLLLAVASVTYAVAVPKPGESFTEFYLLTRGPDGDLVAANYPTEFTLGQAKPVVVGIGNREHRAVTYTVVVELQHVTFVGNNTTRVTDQQQLARFSQHLAANETWHRTLSIRPTSTGTRLRLAFLLYAGDPPTTPTVNDAYRETHLWVNVTAGG